MPFASAEKRRADCGLLYYSSGWRLNRRRNHSGGLEHFPLGKHRCGEFAETLGATATDASRTCLDWGQANSQGEPCIGEMTPLC